MCRVADHVGLRYSRSYGIELSFFSTEAIGINPQYHLQLVNFINNSNKLHCSSLYFTISLRQHHNSPRTQRTTPSYYPHPASQSSQTIKRTLRALQPCHYHPIGPFNNFKRRAKYTPLPIWDSSVSGLAPLRARLVELSFCWWLWFDWMKRQLRTAWDG